MKRWTDTDGFIHNQPNPTLNQTENSPLFTAYVADRGHEVKPQLIALLRGGDKTYEYRANSLSNSTHFSLDNMLGMYYLQLDRGISVRSKPISYWNKELHAHPNTWLPFALVKGYWWFYPLIPLLFIMASYSAGRPLKGDSSGKLLWRLRFRLLERFGPNKFIRKVGYLGVKCVESNNDYTLVRQEYFTNRGHPVHYSVHQWASRGGW